MAVEPLAMASVFNLSAVNRPVILGQRHLWASGDRCRSTECFKYIPSK